LDRARLAGRSARRLAEAPRGDGSSVSMHAGMVPGPMSASHVTGTCVLIALMQDRGMRDLAFGTAIRMTRIKRRLRQSDVAARAGVSATTVWRVEHGRLDELTLGVVRRVCETLEVRVDLQPRGRGSELDRLINARHSMLHEAVARALATDFPGWEQASEVSFNVWGERGIVDLLLWHPGRRALLIIELKTELVDPGDLLATMDIRRRLSSEIVRARGWRPATVSTWVIVARSRTNERSLSAFRGILRTAFPDDGRRMSSWLRDPVGTVAGLSLWGRAGGIALGPVQRVRCSRKSA
jgi:transcriptional regulator with XRE-family HTH domain